ncbi:MAG: monofunctional biosynthetic peptidoglycan transglycosylase [Burkholderiaceae bacterium]|nr:monofunctional biosynthetic peptidoglycan transglycosylase [Burkholderiaceae bacterium]
MSPLRFVARWTWRLVLLALLALAAVQFWYLGWVAYWRWENPGETAFMQRELARLQQKNPKAQLRHQWVPYARISNNLKRAVIAAEDARFTVHEGVDWDAIEKAYEENLKRGRPAKGGSTISQQLAKNLFLSSEKSYARKAQELVITYEVYLNVVEWGDGVFGAEAAARHYYGISAAQLGPEQSARLAAYLPNPKRYGRIRGGPFLDRRTEDILRYLYSVPIP